MKRHHYFFFFWVLIINSSLCAQQWHKIYFPNMPNGTSAVYESYDKGYVMGGDFVSSTGIPNRGLIIKTNINGEMLWYKTISIVDNLTSIWDINQTFDNGFILTGTTGAQTNQHNPFIMKLNKCAELEWCQIYSTPNANDEWGQSIWPIPGGYIALFYVYGDDPVNERIWLYRLNNTGDLTWKKLYTLSDTMAYFTEGLNLQITTNFTFIINGICYYPDPGSPWPQILRPFIVKTDSTGSLDWELPWKVVNNESFHGESYNSVIDNQGLIYSSARHIVYDIANPGDKPCLIKTDTDMRLIIPTFF